MKGQSFLRQFFQKHFYHRIRLRETKSVNAFYFVVMTLNRFLAFSAQLSKLDLQRKKKISEQIQFKGNLYFDNFIKFLQYLSYQCY